MITMILLILTAAIFLISILKCDKTIRWLGLGAQGLSLVGIIYMYYKFDLNHVGYQFEQKYYWTKIFNFSYHVGIDGISLPFLLLTAIIMPLSFLASWNSINHRVKEYVLYFLAIEILVIGSFVALDILLFFMFFEFMLLPMYFIIGIWGGENRLFAAMKFFLVTLVGSVFFLLAIIYLYGKFGSVDLDTLGQNISRLKFAKKQLIWFCFLLSFAVKLPMLFVHNWLPDAHVQAPTAGSMVLAGILLKIGGYAMIRFLLTLFPDISLLYAPYVIGLSLAAITYGSCVAFGQQDIKKMIAYSSIAHMGYVTAGIFAYNLDGLYGAMMQMISHGLISVGLFFAIGVLYERLHTKDIKQFGGVANQAPNLAIICMLLSMASAALPGTSGFIGEFMVLVALYKVHIIFMIIASLGMVLGASYMLWLYRSIFYGKVLNADVLNITDLSKREMFIFLPLVILIIVLGIYPQLLLDIMALPLQNLLVR